MGNMTITFLRSKGGARRWSSRLEKGGFSIELGDDETMFQVEDGSRATGATGIPAQIILMLVAANIICWDCREVKSKEFFGKIC